jgi:nucleotide-binding universal stress UspA family protein
VVETIGEDRGDARVIVIGKRGEAADFAKGHLGSNLERIVRASHKPVFVASRAFKPIDARAILTGAGLEVETTILSGQPDEVLGKRVEEHGAALVAMGAYGHSRIRAFVLGSTTSEMLRSCKAPVLLMR